MPLRSWATPLMIGSFLVMAVTGILIFLHLDSGLNKTLHEWAGLVLLAAAAAHVALNWRPFTLYFRRPLARVLIGAGALALALSFIPVSGQGSLTPGKVFAALGSARIETLAELTGQTPDAAIAALEQAGVTGALPETTVATLAKGDRARQQAILAALFAANPAGAPMNPAAPPS